MAARKNKVHHDPATIERIRNSIQSGQLIKVLMEHVEGKRPLEATQVASALGLLRKTIPDLSASESKSEITVNYVAALPEVSPSVEQWQQKHAPKTIQ